MLLSGRLYFYGYKVMEWILASASPRRKELFAQLVEKFEIIPAKGEEKAESALSPEKLVQVLAEQKAEEIASLPQAKGKWILGADTIVALDNEVLGKPKNEVDAKRMLTALSDREHGVYTGVCFIGTHHGERVKFTDFACTKVLFERLTSEQIDEYIKSGSPMDKAGAYGIQDGGLVKEITGSYSNVVGLPVELCASWIERIEKLR